MTEHAKTLAMMVCRQRAQQMSISPAAAAYLSAHIAGGLLHAWLAVPVESRLA